MTAHKAEIDERVEGRRPNTFTHAIIVAAEFGAYELVDQALSYGADHSVTNSEGVTPLMAMMIGDREPKTNLVAQILEGSREHINATDAKGNTSLHYAAQNRGTNTILLLLANRADPTLINSLGERPADISSSPEKRRLLE